MRNHTVRVKILVAVLLLLAVVGTGPAAAVPADSPPTSAGCTLGTHPALRDIQLCSPLLGAEAQYGAARGSMADEPGPCVPVPEDDLCEDWVSTYDGPAGAGDGAGGGFVTSRIAATSPDGSVFYVLGSSDNEPSKIDQVVVAFDAVTGDQLWASRSPAPEGFRNVEPLSLAADPSGAALVTTGTAYTSDASAATMFSVGLDAATGQQLWASTFSVPSFRTGGLDVTIDATGARAYVAGQIYGGTDEQPVNQAVTVAYDITTGLQLWAVAYAENPGDRTIAWRIAANPDGGRVYVAVARTNENGKTDDVILLVLDAASGGLLNQAHHPTDGFPPAGITVSPDGSRVFVEEANSELSGLNSALTLAYDADGTELWAQNFRPCTTFKCSTRPWYYDPIAVSSDGSQVFVSSLGVLVTAATALNTVAYDAATGDQQWAVSYESNVGDCFCGPSTETNPAGGEVYISSLAQGALLTFDTVTLAYDTARGEQRHAGIFRANNVDDTASSGVAVAPDGSRLFVTGGTASVTGLPDLFATSYVTEFRSEADLSLAVADAPDPVQAGEEVTYTFDAANAGPDPTVVRLRAGLPSGLTVVSASPPDRCHAADDGSVFCNLGVTASGASARAEIVATADAPGEYTVIASVAGSAMDPDQGNNGTFQRTAVEAPPEQSPPPSEEPGPADPGPTDPNPTDPSPTDPSPTDPGGREVRRVAGQTRIETAVQVSQQGYASADEVVLARADDYADALAGGPLSYSLDAPLLLTAKDALDPDVAAEIDRLGAKTAYLLGGEAALSPDVAADLRTAGVTEVRVGGANRYDTARLIAERLDSAEVYLVEGANADPARGWPDAISVAPLAAWQGRPILLTEAGALPGETAQAIRDRGATTVTIVGGEVAVSDEVEAHARDLAPSVERVFGANRYATSAAVGERMLDAGLEATRTWLAQGADWPDALTSGPTVAADQGVLLLVDPRTLDASTETRDFLGAHRGETHLLRLLGGPAAISETVESQARQLLGLE